MMEYTLPEFFMMGRAVCVFMRAFYYGIRIIDGISDIVSVPLNENDKELHGSDVIETNLEKTGGLNPNPADFSENHSVENDLSRILDSYGNAILRLSYSYLHNMEDAEDILQETMIKYLEHGTELSSRLHEKAWLMTVCANLSKNRIHYNKIRETDELNESLAAENREDLSFVWEAVKKLPVNYREAIHLFYQEGYSTKEISEILNRKESSVRSDLKRGREKLKKILKEAYDFE